MTDATSEEPTTVGEESVETELSRDTSLFDITSIGVGTTIGAGVSALGVSQPSPPAISVGPHRPLGERTPLVADDSLEEPDV